MIVHSFMFSYEVEAVDILLKNLEGVVDKFIAVQADNTFRGEPRELTEISHPKLDTVTVHIPEGLDPWQSEAWLRDKLLEVAVEKYPHATYIISDGDEIPHPEAIKEFKGGALKLMTDYRNFYADWRAPEHVLEHQPVMGKYSSFKRAGGANNARWYGNWNKSKHVGWHLSSLGDTSKIKLETFAHTEYDTEEVKANLNNTKLEMKDFLGRFDLEYTTDIPKGVPEHLLGGKHD